jgi:cytochrome c1
VTRHAWLFALSSLLCGLLSSGCQRLSAYVPGLDPGAAHAIELANQYGCASCHEIPGAGVTGYVGPTLRNVQRRAYLAGGLPNTPDTMVQWIRFPDRARPGTLMPTLNVSEADARELADFLYTLR